MKSNTFLCLICSILMLFVLLMPKSSIFAAAESLRLWSTSIFPSLFPFFVLSSILKQTGLVEQAIYKSAKRLDYNLIFTTVIGFMCGYPSTSKLIGQSESMTNPLPIYALSTSPSPVFIVGTVCTLFLQNTGLALYLLPATYLSLFTSYLVVRHFCKSGGSSRSAPPKVSSKPLGHLITTAILDGMKSQAIILGIITSVSVLGAFLEATNAFTMLAITLSPIASFIGVPKSAIPAFLRGLLEMTTGVNAICTQNISVYHKLAACGFITSFGGMSIILESLSFINNKIKATSIIGIKLLHGSLTYLCIRLLLFAFPISQNVVLSFTSSVSISPVLTFAATSAFSAAILAALRQISRREI